MSLYEELVAAGIEIDNHASDLYVAFGPDAYEIVCRHVGRDGYSLFCNNTDGAVWMDVPFAYEPFWQQAAGSGQRAAAREVTDA